MPLKSHILAKVSVFFLASWKERDKLEINKKKHIKTQNMRDNHIMRLGIVDDYAAAGTTQEPAQVKQQEELCRRIIKHLTTCDEEDRRCHSRG